MSDLILSWLNDEVQLSSKVTDFEHDFANGFLFGELLSKYNQQLNFNEFSNKYSFTKPLPILIFCIRDLRNSKINNFKLLEPTFKTLKIKFNAQIADAITNPFSEAYILNFVRDVGFLKFFPERF